MNIPLRVGISTLRDHIWLPLSFSQTYQFMAWQCIILSAGNAIYSHGVLENHFHRGLFSISVSRSSESSIKTMTYKISAANYSCLDTLMHTMLPHDESSSRQVHHIFILSKCYMTCVTVCLTTDFEVCVFPST